MKLKDIRAGMPVRIRDDYRLPAQEHNAEALDVGGREPGGIVTRVECYVRVLTDDGWQCWPQVRWGCIRLTMNPADLEPVTDE